MGLVGEGGRRGGFLNNAAWRCSEAHFSDSNKALQSAESILLSFKAPGSGWVFTSKFWADTLIIAGCAPPFESFGAKLLHQFYIDLWGFQKFSHLIYQPTERLIVRHS